VPSLVANCARFLASDLWRRELLVPQLKLVILNVTEGGVKDLLYLPFDIGAKRRSANSTL
jgi:hypothetical protein